MKAMENQNHRASISMKPSHKYIMAITGIVIAICTLSLYGWITGRMWLTRLSVIEVPIAPLTIIIFILLAVILYLLTRYQANKGTPVMVRILAVILMGISGVLFIARLLDINTDWEHYSFNPKDDMPFMTGHVSPVTASFFILIGCIILLSISKRKLFRDLSVFILFPLLFLSLVYIMGYMYGTPFYYKGDFIPPAALTVFLFLMVLIALALTIDKEAYLIRKISSKSTTARLLKIFLPSTLLLIFIEDFFTIQILPKLNTNPVFTILFLEILFVSMAGYIFYLLSRNIGKSLDLITTELRNTNEFLNAILNSIPVNIFWKDRKSIYKGCNASFAHEAGFMASEDVIGKSDFDFFWNQYASLYQQDDRNVIESGIPKLFFEEKTIGKDGTIKVLLTSKVPLKDDKANIIGILGSYLDISERKKIENDLRENDIRMQKLSVNVPGMIYQFLRKPDGSFCVPFATEAIHEVFGCSPEDVKFDYAPIARAIHPEDLQRVIQAIEISAQNLSLWQCEYRVALPGKETRWMIGQSSPEQLPDGSILWHGFTSDITERKIIEAEMLRAKEAAEESNRLKSAFLANMSHEIRTPMNGILGFTNLLTDPDLTSEDKDHYIDIIHKSGQRMLNTINDIIEVSIIEAGPLNVTISEFNPFKRIEELFNFLRPEAEQKGIHCQLISKSEKSIIRSDEVKFNSIVTNLIKNAIKYTDSGSIIVELGISGQSLQVTVQDTGVGVPQDKLEAIFDRFEQVNPDPSRLFEGSGLGLSICKSYVECLGGSIHVKSALGKGSTFIVNLPLDNNSALFLVPTKEEVTEPPVLNMMDKINILVVEDDLSSIEYFRIILKDVSKQTFFASTASQAIMIARENPDLHLILMDIRIPGGDGYITTQAIREFNPEVVIIAQSAHSGKIDRQKAMEAGCNDYITKPINRRDLKLLIEKHFLG
jgi:PAS domain S-box-containing protein